MSADLLLASLVIDKDKGPDFEAGRLAIERLGTGDVEVPEEFYEEDPDSAEGLAAIRGTLRQDLRQLEATLAWGREIGFIEVRGATVYLTGGMSNGDEPTEIFAVINRLSAVRGVLAAVGFETEG